VKPMTSGLLCAAFLMALAGCEPSGPAPETFEFPPEGVATEATRFANEALAKRLPLDDPGDFEDATRGRLAQIEGGIIRNEDGSIAWDANAYGFLNGDAPETVNPSLWRQGRLNAEHGLFELAPGLYQVRGYDLAVMTLIEGETGWIVIDPLLTPATARAGLALADKTLGQRPISAILFTHSHADHFGGVAGLFGPEGPGPIPIIAPLGFTHEAVSENVMAGNAMGRRASFMFGDGLPYGPTGQVGTGLGQALAKGPVTFIPPTEEVGPGHPPMTIDGIVFEFVDAAGTEAPAEFMFYLPKWRALCTAEVATATFHNILTLRGAKVRDALHWSKTLDAVLLAYGDKTDLVFASHHWPTFGPENVIRLLENQRDLYRYIHDQTLRRANAGATPHEIADTMDEPAVMARDFGTRGYYGTLNHNAKAVYQAYFGWWDGVPAHLNPLAPEQEAKRYVAAMGGREAVIALGKTAFGEGDYRWAATLFNHLVFADTRDTEARRWLAASYEQIGFQAESGAWRNYFLRGAQELRSGEPEASDRAAASPAFMAAISTISLFDALAARYDADRGGEPGTSLVFVFPDTEEVVSVLIRDGLVVPRLGWRSPEPAATVTMTRRVFDGVLTGQVGFPGAVLNGTIGIEGNPLAVRGFLGALDQPDADFAVVAP